MARGVHGGKWGAAMNTSATSEGNGTRSPAVREQNRRLRLWLWVLTGLGVPLLFIGLYALSYGPAVWLMQHRRIESSTVERVYMPIEGFADLIPGGVRLLHRYVELWVQEPPAP